MELNWTTFILETINFLVLVWILKRLFYQPVRKMIDQRKQAIDQSMQDAARMEQESLSLQQKYNRRLQDWESEKRVLHADYMRELDEEKRARFAQLETELEGERNKAAARERLERLELVRQAEKTAMQLAGQFMAKLLGRVAHPALEKILVDLTIEQLNSQESEHTLQGFNGETDPIKIMIESAFNLDESQRDQLEASLARLTGKSIQAEYSINPQIISGLQISLGSYLINANLRAELQFFVGMDA